MFEHVITRGRPNVRNEGTLDVYARGGKLCSKDVLSLAPLNNRTRMHNYNI